MDHFARHFCRMPRRMAIPLALLACLIVVVLVAACTPEPVEIKRVKKASAPLGQAMLCWEHPSDPECQDE